MKAINKLNETLKYNSKVNNRNVVAAICVLEFDLLKEYVTTHEEDEFLDKLSEFCKREMYSNIPMKLFSIEEIMPEYKLRSGKPCKMKDCNCSCLPSDGSITIAKLAEDTIELIESGGGIGVPTIPVVSPQLFVNWVNLNDNSMSNNKDITVEVGSKYQWNGAYKWESKEGYKNPYKITSNVFEELTDNGVMSNVVTKEVNNTTTFDVTFTAPNGATSTTTSTITFAYRVYFNIGNKEESRLVTSQVQTFDDVTTDNTEFIVYKYPVAFPKLKQILMDDVFNVIQAFDYATDGQYHVYTSANPGAFTNAKLTFK